MDKLKHTNGFLSDDIFESKREYKRHHIKDCETTLDWYDLFVDYIEEVNINLYNEACEYADKNN